MGDAIKLVPKAEELSEMHKALAEFKKSLPLVIEYNIIRARIQRETYLELTKQGFTEDQAIELVKAVQ